VLLENLVGISDLSGLLDYLSQAGEGNIAVVVDDVDPRAGKCRAANPAELQGALIREGTDKAGGVIFPRQLAGDNDYSSTHPPRLFRAQVVVRSLP